MSSLVSVRSPLVSAVGMTGLSEESVKSDGTDGATAATQQRDNSCQIREEIEQDNMTAEESV